jgi:hypothetical protein
MDHDHVQIIPAKVVIFFTSVQLLVEAKSPARAGLLLSPDLRLSAVSRIACGKAVRARANGPHLAIKPPAMGQPIVAVLLEVARKMISGFLMSRELHNGSQNPLKRSRGHRDPIPS